MEYRLLILPLLLLLMDASAQSPAVETFPLSDVRLLDGPFRQAQQTDRDYLLALDPDRLLAPYRAEAGLPPKKDRYGNWEGSGLGGHIGGHYLSALAMLSAATGDAEVQQRLDYVLTDLEQCQQQSPTGYLGGVPGSAELWADVAAGRIDAGNFSLNDRWVPLYNIHKIFAGLRDAWYHTGSERARDMLVRLSDWAAYTVAGLSDAQLQDMLRSEHGGLNEIFADVAAITGDDRYLGLARRFSHRWLLEPLLHEEDRLDGMHANTQIPKVIGFERIAAVGGDTSWHRAARFFWETVTQHRSVVIGGNSVREHFHATNDFSSAIESVEGPETCNTYNMLRLSKQLYEASGATRYLDFYERGLYNHILSSQHPDQGGFVYFTPLRPRHYRVYSQPEQGMWCCVGSGLENHTKYGELIYAHTGADSLYVNLFIPSTLQWRERGIALAQQTRFPDAETTELRIDPAEPTAFTLLLRYPAWVAPGQLQVSLNGEALAVNGSPGGYFAIPRTWQKGDRLTVTLPMQTTLEQLPDGSDYYAVLHGPIALAAKTDTTDLTGLWADDSRMGHIAAGTVYPLDAAPLLVGDPAAVLAAIKPVSNAPLTFSATAVLYPDTFRSLRLIPFFRLHEARYVLYWPLVGRAGLDQRQAEIAAREQVQMQLAARTIDQVAPGEQQPESDHFFRGEDTESGLNGKRHWRHARRWFSYQLRDPEREARVLRITYFGADQDRHFEILLDGKPLATVHLDGSRGTEFYTVDYPIPAELGIDRPAETVTVKFAAQPGSLAGGIYGVRLLRE